MRGTNPLEVYPLDELADIEPGDIVCGNAAGKAVEAADEAGLYVLGIAVRVDKDAKTVEVRDGIVALDLAGSNAPERTDRGKPVYAVSPTEVATGSEHGVIAGVLVDVHEGEAYVDVRPGNAAAAAAGAAAGAASGATAGGDAVTADLADAQSAIKAAAKAEAEGAISADLEAAQSEIKGATLGAAGNVRLVGVPAGTNAAGVKGDVAYDDTHVYICVDEDSWVRASLAKDGDWTTTV